MAQPWQRFEAEKGRQGIPALAVGPAEPHTRYTHARYTPATHPLHARYTPAKHPCVRPLLHSMRTALCENGAYALRVVHRLLGMSGTEEDLSGLFSR